MSSITGYLSKGNKIKLPKRYMQKICITVHSLFTTAETWKQPKCPLTLHKQGVMHTHTRNVTLFSREKEGPPVIRDSTDEPWGPYTKWADSDRNRYYTCSLYMAPKKSHSQERSLQWRLPGLGSRGRRGGIHQSAHMSGWKANEFGDLITAWL